MSDMSPPLTASEAATLGGTLIAVPGLVGPAGPAGMTGTRIFVTAGVLPAWDHFPQTGDIFITTAAFQTFQAWTVFVYNAATFFWDVVGNIAGPPGEGLPGPPGPIGPMGPVGGMALAAVPATSTSDGVQGQIALDADYVYYCVQPNVWKRSALSSW